MSYADEMKILTGGPTSDADGEHTHPSLGGGPLISTFKYESGTTSTNASSIVTVNFSVAFNYRPLVRFFNTSYTEEYFIGDNLAAFPNAALGGGIQTYSNTQFISSLAKVVRNTALGANGYPLEIIDIPSQSIAYIAMGQ